MASCRAQSWSSRTTSGSNQGGLKGSGETLSRRADLVSPDLAANRARQPRPKHSRDNVVRVLNRRGHDWTVERLRRAVHCMVREELAEPDLLVRSPRRAAQDHLMKLVAAIAIADPSLSLRDIAGQLDQMGSGPRAVDANGNRRQAATCWMRRNGSALSTTEHEHAEVRRFAGPVRWERLPVLLDRVTGDRSVGLRILSKTPRMPGAWAASVSCSESR